MGPKRHLVVEEKHTSVNSFTEDVEHMADADDDIFRFRLRYWL
jgi:hypothetical protein